MFPILCKIPIFGGIPINTYGILVALGFLAAIRWVSGAAQRKGQSAERMTDLAFYMVAAAIIGSRFMYVLVAGWEEFTTNPLTFFKLWEGGLVFYGGLIACLVVALWYFRRHRLNGWVVADIFAPAIALGHAIGRLGCLMAGCCFGKPTDGDPWYALTFPMHERIIAPPHVPLYPTQLIESAAEFLIFGVLVWVGRRKQFNGQLICLYIMFYAVVRGIVELFRGDIERGFIVGSLSTSQGVGILLFLIAFTLYRIRYQTHHTTEQKGRLP